MGQMNGLEGDPFESEESRGLDEQAEKQQSVDKAYEVFLSRLQDVVEKGLMVGAKTKDDHFFLLEL